MLTVAAGLGVPGGHCGVPPSAWCQSWETALRCGALEHCTRHAWAPPATVRAPRHGESPPPRKPPKDPRPLAPYSPHVSQYTRVPTAHAPPCPHTHLCPHATSPFPHVPKPPCPHSPKPPCPQAPMSPVPILPSPHAPVSPKPQVPIPPRHTSPCHISLCPQAHFPASHAPRHSSPHQTSLHPHVSRPRCHLSQDMCADCQQIITLLIRMANESATKVPVGMGGGHGVATVGAAAGVMVAVGAGGRGGVPAAGVRGAAGAQHGATLPEPGARVLQTPPH